LLKSHGIKSPSWVAEHFCKLPKLTIIKKRDKSVTMLTSVAMTLKLLRGLMIEQWIEKTGLKEYDSKNKKWRAPSYLTLDVTHLDPNLRSLTLINKAVE
jgi:hypothetical protein